MRIPNRPWMQNADIRAIESVIEELSPQRVLEWGAGGSTIYWPPKFGFIQEWIAIEHNEEVLADLRGRVGGSVILLHIEVDDLDYLNPAEGKFDLILVDGRDRVRCVRAGLDMLAEGGVVLLHDALRIRYSELWELEHSQKLTEGRVPYSMQGKQGYKRDGVMAFWRPQ